MTDSTIEEMSYCQVCSEAALREVAPYSTLPRITSDCRAFPSGGRLAVCSNCGAVQKIVSAVWLAEIKQIYADYAAYYQAGGDEQIVFDTALGQPRRRSDVVADRLSQHGGFPSNASMLDIGCGNGVTLKSLQRVFPEWELNGFEIGEGNLGKLKEIPKFARLYTGEMDQIKRNYVAVAIPITTQ